MKSFIQWASQQKLELPVYNQTESGGSTARAGIAYWAYPDGYIRSHYPDAYFMSRASDALWKMSPGPPITKYKHHVSHETPPDYAIGPNGELEYEKEIDYETD
jgi:hypothetical protein